ncbi:helicase and polymerase-containing protein TEBICHI isoform X1 [Cryptomeria japonica]|uniref:helicase and polymerase-containing protein TEBICHI isoform X1 n=1 Tax=Cryptomeria japonica TaxID=3369 RepID=UPI0027D9D57D|nr:helicase and polymerase-containing protein TEBICHI isoform X1 [Cryptomeria japonica]
MNPNLRNARVDQFFPSKKKKCLSPSGKLLKINKDVSSPNTKCSLDGYLVNSHDGLISPDHVRSSSHDSNKGDTAKQNLTFEAKQHSPLLEKTSQESSLRFKPCSSSLLFSLSSKASHENEEGKTIEHGKEVYSDPALLEENGKPSDMNHGSIGLLHSEAGVSSAGFSNKDQISSHNGHGEELSQFANSFLAMCSRLSFYPGSGLVLKEASSNEEPLASQKINRNKRPASVSELSPYKDILRKKQCSVEDGNNLPEILLDEPYSHNGKLTDHASNTGNELFASCTSQLQDLPVGQSTDVTKKFKGQENDSNEQIVQHTSKVFKNAMDASAKSSESNAMQNSQDISEIDGPVEFRGFFISETPKILRKCSGTPENGIEQIVLFTPNAVVVKGSSNTTPTPENGRQCISPFTPNAAVNEGSANKALGWVYRSSLSPGDEFWNDAIQVADGLVAAKTDNNARGDCDASAHTNSEDVQENSFSDKIERCTVNTQNLESHNAANRVSSGNKLQQSVVSGREFHCAASEAPDLSVSSSKVPMPEECTENNEKIHVGRVGLSKTTGIGNSALPVRHFNVLFEDNITMNNTQDYSSKAEDCRVTEVVNADTSDEHLKDDAVQNSENQGYEKKITVINRNAAVCNDSPVVEELELAETKGKDPSELSLREENIKTPSSNISFTDNLELRSWLPDKICEIYAKKGITKLYPWQVECLQLDGVLERRNLVYCASTSAGKSLVAEVLLLRRVISTGKRALLVLPYVSLCAEKTEHMETLLEPFDKRVRSFYGNQGSGTLPKDTCLAVCTIEKANSLVNRLLEEGRLAEVGIMVIDELHMVGDQSRGYLLELMLTKLRYATGEGDWGNSNVESPGNSSGKTDPNLGIQIVGMSATMPNVQAVSNWLQAALYETEFRPVPLDEFIKVGNTVYNKKMEVVRAIPKGSDLGGKDPDHVVELCNEVVQSGHSVLVFCSSRKACETTARHIAKFIKEFSCSKMGTNCQFKDGSAAVEELRKCPAGLDATLAETVPSGVAYHHAGLTVEEREIIETCYKQGIVRVLTATSTLAAGVNLPARRVVFRQPRIGRDFIDGTKYRQMAGRAGRAGIDTKGESILICKPEEVKRITNMLNEGCPPLQSCLSDDKNGMKRAILEVVAGGIVQTANDINCYVRCTLLNSTQPFEDVVKSAQESLRWLCHAKFLEWDQQSQVYSTTPLGRAAFGSSLSPEESLTVLEDLARAREGFVLASDLHLLYEITPINVDIQPDWELYYQRFMELCPLDQAVGNRVGIMEPFLMRMAHGAPILQHDKSSRNGKSPRDKSSRLLANRKNSSSTPSIEQTLRVCRRFYVALMLAQLVQEVPLNVVCEDFKVPRGMIQVLQESAGRFASMITAFCERLGWHDLEGLVSKFQNRVSFGVRAEIVELTSIPFVKAARARALFKAGLRTAQAVAEASLLELVKALFEASSWAAQDGSRNDMQRRIQIGVAKKIKNGARQIVLDQAEEARVAAFTAFKALGLNVPLSLSQPIPASSSGVSLNQDNSETLPEKLYDENNQLFRDPISELWTTDNQIAAKYADKDGMTLPIEERTKDRDTTSLIRGDLSLQNTVDKKNMYPNNVNDGKYGQPFVGEGVSDTEILQKRSEDNMALGNEINIVSRNNDKNEVNVVSEGALMFSGFSFEHETNQDRHKLNETVNPTLYNGPIDVNNISGGFEAFLNKWELVNEFCFDLHFSNGSVKDSSLMFEIHGLAICWDGSPVYYVSFSKRSMDTERNDAHAKGKYDIAKERWEKVAKVMCKKGVKKITWSLKNQFQAFTRPGISMPNINQSKDESCKKNELLTAMHLVALPSVDVEDAIDLCLVAWLLWPDEESTDYPTLEQEVKKRLSGEVAASANRAGRWINQMGRVAHNGCCRHVAQVRALYSNLWKLILSEGLDQVLRTLEMPLVKVLADMENWGIGIDMEVCWKAKRVLELKLRELEDKAQMLAGVTFSLSTPADVANVLYSHLKLSIPGGCNKGKQHPSTDKHVLELLRNHHPVVGVIKEHRTLAKLLSCTVNTVLSRARIYEGSKWYSVRGHWLQTSTATGRLSMEEPNLQRVEHEIDFRIESNEIGVAASKIDQHQINARDFFVPTQENWLLISADYSQIELRLMAHFSGDSSLINLLKKPDGDVFIMMAARWTGKDECAITEKQRDQTKKLIYGILYGMGVNTLAEQLECSVAEASERYERFRTVFPGVSSWLQHAVDDCRHKGYITTLSGRKRFLGKIKFGNRVEQARAERQAVNSICQGSAADIIKMAMVKVHSTIAIRPSEGDLDTSQTSPSAVSSLKGNCRLLLQIHDELLLEVKSDMLSEAALLVRSSMEGAASLKVPLRVKLQVGRTWGSLTPYKEIE